jgi:hypothetical protein
VSDERQVVTQIRRKGDPVAPTISDVNIDGLALVILERPRKPDPRDYVEGAAHPCIPGAPGDGIAYDVDWTENVHPKHPFCYEIMNVPGRTAILQHSANWIRQLEGCQAPGLRAEIVEGTYHGQAVKELGVSSSVAALGMLQDKLQRKNYRLIIIDENA